jgi:antitoxin CptB
MSGTARSSEGLDQRRRKLLFRSWHRGIREMDLILGGFADAAIATLTEAELDQYEHLLELQDADLLSWFTREHPVPAAFDTQLLKKIMASRAAAT